MAFNAQRPEEPANINWQAMHIKVGEKVVRSMLVFMALGFLMSVAMQAQLLLLNLKDAYASYDQVSDCPIIQNRNQYKNHAFAAWAEWDSDLHQTVNSTLACFCDSEFQQEGYFTSVSNEYSYSIKKSQANENRPVKLHKMGG